METARSLETLHTRLGEVRRRIAACAERSRRAPEEITLIAVSKTHPAEMVRQAIEAGAHDLGENRVQEAVEKIEAVGRPSGVRWHLIGHLQANKARRAVKYFDIIHTVDSIALAERLARLCREEKRDELPVMIQVDLAGEATKSGADEEQVPELIAAISSGGCLRLVGLMTLPPFFEEAERVRPFFRRLRQLRDTLQARGVFGAGGGHLSMGMSHDYEIAIEEGATMVRVGTAIFGARAAHP